MTGDGTRANPLERIVIAGDGWCAWLAAAALGRALGGDRVRVVGCGDGESDDALADATLPMADGLHPALEVDEDAVVAATGGAFTLGIALSGWATPGATYFHPFGSIGAALGPVSFPHLVMRLRRDGKSMKLANYSLAALAAQSGRFAKPDSNPRSVRSTFDYGLHLDCAAFAGACRDAAEASGVRREKRPLERVEPGDDGAIQALVLRGGRRVAGDLFLDCTGAEARLHAAVDDAGREDWSAWLPCDRRVTTVAEAVGSPPAFSHAEAHAAGWIRHLPLAGKTVLTSYHRAELMSDDEACALLAGRAGNGAGDARATAVRFGRRRRPWQKNCLALGTACAVVDPVGLSDLQLARTALDRLLELLPATRDGRAEAAEYNRRTALELDHARDFALLHYKLNGRRGETLWDRCRAMPLPASLDYKLRLYESRGRVPMYDEEPLDEISWINLCDEHGIRPRHYNQIANGFATGDLEAHLDRVRAIMIDEVARMPRHGDFLARLGTTTTATSAGGDPP